MKKPCPNCFNFVDSKAQECPICHKEIKRNTKNKGAENRVEPKENSPAISPNLEELAKQAAAQEIATEMLDKTAEKDQSVDTKKDKQAKDMYHQKNGRIKWVPRRKRMVSEIKSGKITSPRVDGIHIDVSDVSYFERSRFNKYKPSAQRTLIENNGKYELEKLKWWEIYKWADRQLVRNKIKKVVKKEAVKKPEGISSWCLGLLCLFAGFLGVHNFYAKNYKRGIVSAACFSMALIFVAVLDKIAFFSKYFQGLLCALPGIVVIVIWLTDFVAILFRRFKFRTSKISFIKSLDLETRARLGKKYIYIV